MPSQLFSPFTLRSLALSNRIVVSPMCQYSADDGAATAWHLMHLGQFAVGGAGLVWIEATGVEARGRITAACLGIWTDAHAKALEPVVAFYRKHGGAKLGIQLAHAGRKASCDIPWKTGKPLTAENGAWEAVAPSAVPYDTGWAMPRALDEAGLREVRDNFVAAARRSVAIGLDAIELHGAHGYLLHEFLSPLSNLREDAYGGSLENRMRFPLEVFEAVREVAPETMPVGIRISATDWVEGGWDIVSSVAFAKELKKRGCDFIDVSSSGLSPLQKITAGPGFQAPFAGEIRRQADIPTMAVGLITDPKHAEDLVAHGTCDFVAMARAMLDDPHWAWHAAKVLGAEAAYPPQYLRSKK